jgi:hypothetical protein
VTSLDARVRVMVFNATFNNISVLSWQSVLLVEETGVPREKQVKQSLDKQMTFVREILKDDNSHAT